MHAYVVENIYGREPIYTSNIVGVFDHINKAAWTVWETLNRMYSEGMIEDDAPSIVDIIKSNGANYKRVGKFEGLLKITKYEVL